MPDRRVLISFEGTDSGLSAAATRAVTSIDSVVQAIQRFQKQGTPEKNISANRFRQMAQDYKNMADTVRVNASQIKAEYGQLDEKLRQYAQAVRDVKRLESARDTMGRQIAMLEKQGQATDEARLALARYRVEYERLSRNTAKAAIARDELNPVSNRVAGLKAVEMLERSTDLDARAKQYDQMARSMEKVARMRDSGFQIQSATEGVARKLVSLNDQITQAVSKEVTERRIALQLAKDQQDAEVQAAVAAQKRQQQSAQVSGSQKAGGYLTIAAQAASRASTIFGGTVLAMQAMSKGFDASGLSADNFTGKVGRISLVLGGLGQFLLRTKGSTDAAKNSMMGMSGVSDALNGKIARLAVVAGIAFAGVGKLVGVMGKLAGLAASGAKIIGKAYYAALMAAARAISFLGTAAMNAIGNVARFTGRIASSIKTLLEQRNAARESSRAMGQAVDATGWHSRSLKGLVGNVTNLNRWVNMLGASVRQLGQAFQNAGMTLSIFLSYPTTRVLKNMWQTAVDFDEQLIEIRKNADLAMESLDPNEFTLETMKGQLEDIAMSSPTPPEALAKIAADAARLGLPVEMIGEFTRVMDQLSVATTLTAENATTQMGRILNIFYDMSSGGVSSGEEFIDIINGVGSAINELGQANPITEDELVAATMRLAPAAKAIGMEITDALGLAASVAGASASPERAGTQLNTAFTKMAVNIEKVAAASGVTVDIMSKLIGDDPAETFIAIADAIAQIPDEVARVNAANELFGMIGGKAVNIVGQGYEKVVENVALSRQAFEDGESLMREFSRAMDGVKNQTGLLNNQLKLIGISLADAFLPFLTQILSYVIPTLQALVKIFAGVDDRIKLGIVAFGLFAAALGPVMVAIGSFLFSIGIATTSMTVLVSAIGNAITPFLHIGGWILSMLSPLRLIVVAVGAVIASMVFFGNTLGEVGQWVVDFATNMYTWGYNAFKGFGDGIAAAAEYIVATVVWLLESIAVMLESFSPPKAGPLKNIDKWGTNLATTFADAFSAGDLSGILEFAGKISWTLERALRSFNPAGLKLFENLSGTVESIVKAIGGDVNGALESLAYLVDSIQHGFGNFGEMFNALGFHLGPFVKDFELLVKLQTEFSNVEDELEKVGKELDKLDSKVNDQVRGIATNQSLSVGQRVASIRRTRAAGARTRESLERRQGGLNERKDELSTLIEQRKGLIDTFLKFFGDSGGGGGGGSGSSAADKIAKIDDGLKGLKPNIDGVKEDIEGLQEKMAEKFAQMSADVGTFVGKIVNAREEIRGFIDGLLGKNYREDDLRDQTEPYQKGFFSGKNTNQSIFGFLDKLIGYTQPIITLKDQAQALVDVFTIGAQGGAAKESGDESAFQKIIFGVPPEKVEAYAEALGSLYGPVLLAGLAFGALGVAASNYLETLKTLFVGGEDQSLLDRVLEEFQEFGSAFSEAFNGVFGGESPDGGNLLAPLATMTELLVVIAGLAFDNLDKIGTVLGIIAGTVVQAWGLAGAFAAIAMSALGFTSLDRLEKAIELLGDDNLIAEVVNNALAIGDSSDTLGQQIVDYIVAQIQAADFTQIGATFVQRLGEAIMGPLEPVTTPESGQAVSSGVSGFVGAVVQFLGGALSQVDVQPLVDGLALMIGAVADGLKNNQAALTMIGIALGKAIVDVFGAIPSESLAGAAVSIVNALADSINATVEGNGIRDGFKRLGTSIVNGLASIQWKSVSGALVGLLEQFIWGLADVPWGKLSGPLIDLVTSLLTELAKPSLWEGAGNLLGGVAGAIASAIIDAPWGDLFNGKALSSLANAFIKGFWEGIWEARNGAGADVAGRAAQLGVTTPEGGLAFLDNQTRAMENMGEADKERARKDLATVAGFVIQSGTPIPADLDRRIQENNGYTGASWYEVVEAQGSEFNTQMTDWAQENVRPIIDRQTSQAVTPEFQENVSGNIKGATKASERIAEVIGVGSKETQAPIISEAWGGWNDLVNAWDNAGFNDPDTPVPVISDILRDAQSAVAAVDRIMSNPTTQTMLPIGSDMDALESAIDGGFGTGGIGQALYDFFVAPFTEPLTKSAGASDTSAYELPNQAIPGQMIGPRTAQQAGYQAPPEPSSLFLPAISTGTEVAAEQETSKYDAMLTSFTGWIEAKAADIQAAGGALFDQIALGITARAIEDTTGFDGITSGMLSWILAKVESLKSLGGIVSAYIATGISFRFTDDTAYFDAIVSGLESWIGAQTQDGALDNGGQRVGAKITDAIATGIVNNWKDIADGIEEAVRRAIAAVDVSTDTGGGGGGTGNNATGTSWWGGGWSWVGERGRELVWMPGGSRVMSNEDSMSMLMGAVGSDGIYSAPEVYYSDDRKAESQIVNVNIGGDVVVDSKRRMDDLVDKISVELGRRARLASATR